MSEASPGVNWAEMKREEFEKQPDPRPAPPGQGELFEAPSARPRRRRTKVVETCPYGTIDLMSLVEQER